MDENMENGFVLLERIRIIPSKYLHCFELSLRYHIP